MKHGAILIAVSIAAAHTAIFAPQAYGAADKPAPGKVTITGTAERTIEADLAVIRLAVNTSDRKLKETLKKNNSIRTDIVTKLSSAGIDADRIHTSRFSSTPNRSSWSGKVKDYFVSSTVWVDVKSEKEMQDVAGLVDEIKEVELNSISFKLNKTEEIVNSLLKDALESVNRRKKIYESELGVKLRPHSVAPRKGKHNYQNLFKDDLNDPEILTNPDSCVILHALSQRPPQTNQFDSNIYRINISVIFDIIPAEKDADSSPE